MTNIQWDTAALCEPISLSLGTNDQRTEYFLMKQKISDMVMKAVRQMMIYLYEIIHANIATETSKKSASYDIAATGGVLRRIFGGLILPFHGIFSSRRKGDTSVVQKYEFSGRWPMLP